MLEDGRYQALQEYIYQLGIGDGSKYANAVMKGKHTDFLAAEHLIDSVDGHNWRITERGKTIYWNESYLRLKDVLFQINQYTKLGITGAKDVDTLRNILQGILMLISGDIQLKDGMIEFQDKTIFPADFNFASLDEEDK